MASDPVFGPAAALAGLALEAAKLGACLTLLAVLLAVLALGLALLYLGVWYTALRPPAPARSGDVTVGFFHPYCDAGGGGERVLWAALLAMKKRFPSARFVVYTGDVDAAPDQILSKANKRFNLNLDERDDSIEFVYLHRRKYVEADRYPYFTLLGQSLGSIYLAFEALDKCRPDLFIDTMGYAFTLPVFKYFGLSKISAYVHYPTISTDMLDKVRSRRTGFNNAGRISGSWLATRGKLIYYKIFARLYGLAGRCASVAMVNSSWTEGHIRQLWDSVVIRKVYPPCDTSEFSSIKRNENEETIRVVSVAQFRPEKDHPLQIRALAKTRDKILDFADGEAVWKKIRLVLIGGVRNEDDERRVRDLKALCSHLAVEDNVEFKVNLPFNELKEEMGRGLIGLHTMWNEHFGIAVVEMLAAGLMTLAHRSGGPLMDIVVESPEASRNGWLAVTEEEYATAITEIALHTSNGARQEIRDRAQDSVARRFSQSEFEANWIAALETLVDQAKQDA